MNGDAGDRPYRPVLEAAELLLAPGGVAELRAIGADGRVSSGYFDSPAALAAAAEVLDDAAESMGIYATLNPVEPALLARRANRVQRRLGARDATTADADILCRRWLPVDVDPVRPGGVSATGEEHRAALAVARTIRDALAAEGWPRPVVADSGNGGHLLYRVDLANDDASTALVKAALVALDARFSTAAARVDTANHNAARIWKVYGTVSRKGDSTRDRPHARSAIVSRPYEPEVVPAERLRALAASLPPAAPAPAERTGGLDLGAWLAGHGIAVKAERPWQGGTLYTLAACPFSDAHADGAYAVRFANGAIHLGCKHDSCGGGRQRWQELRARLEPAYAAPPPTGPGAPGRTPPPAPGPDPEVAAAATAILERGDPVRAFLDCFARDHVGDLTLARCLVASVASQAVRNSSGLHVYVTGESGKGKSSGMTAMLRQVPDEFKLAERLSNKALYYSDDLRPGTVLLLDDIALSEELQEVLKEATSHFAEPVRMRSVDAERKVRRYSIPERCAWWLANVAALYDDQVLNRMLTCWVDDSEEQDREVFARRMAAVAKGEDGGADRTDLRVCREIWRRLREGGPHAVRVPFADRIRMASVRNRRNPGVLVDLVRSHALVFRFQRETGPDGAVVATREDFRYAAELFAELHGAGGSLGEKVDRNEDLVLALAARRGLEQFTVRDLQQWTGWSYHKARRILLGRTVRGVQYPCLLDKSPALSVLDRTTSEEEDGRAATHRQLVFLFDPEIHRETAERGQAWLEDEPDRCHNPGCGNTVARPVATSNGDYSDPRSENPATGAEIVSACCHRSDRTEGAPAPTGAATDGCISGSVATSFSDIPDPDPDGRSGGRARCADVATDVAPPFATVLPQRVCGTPVDPRRYAPTGAPLAEACDLCGRLHSFYRERQGGPGRLCRACFSRAVERERRRVPPLPAVIDPTALRRAAGVGRCDVCGLAAADWHGDRTRLCDACYRREVRRGVARGDGGGAPAEA